MDDGFPLADFSVASHLDGKAGRPFTRACDGMLANYLCKNANATGYLRHNICQTDRMNRKPGQRLHTDRTY
jgi:hypothetical protein